VRFSARFDLWHAWVPFAAFGLSIALIMSLDADRWLAERFFVDVASGHWLGEGTFWADTLLHVGAATSLVCSAWPVSWRCC
jgi:membrane-associated PAP2 superfamily phosphatase